MTYTFIRINYFGIEDFLCIVLTSRFLEEGYSLVVGKEKYMASVDTGILHIRQFCSQPQMNNDKISNVLAISRQI